MSPSPKELQPATEESENAMVAHRYALRQLRGSPGSGVPQLDVSYPNFEDWERTWRSFQSIFALTIHNFDLTAYGDHG